MKHNENTFSQYHNQLNVLTANTVRQQTETRYTLHFNDLPVVS